MINNVPTNLPSPNVWDSNLVARIFHHQSTASYRQVAEIGHHYFTLSAHSLNCCTCSDLPVSFVELLTLSSFYPRYCLTVLVDFGYQEMYECISSSSKLVPACCVVQKFEPLCMLSICAYYPESS
jgi:hypothetical protein